MIKKLVSALTAAALVMSLAGTATAAKPRSGTVDRPSFSDNLRNPRAEAQSAERQQAHEKVIMGSATAKGANQVVKLAKNRYVELAREGEDSILTVLGEFGSGVATDHPASHGSHAGPAGPLHNQIPSPDRKVDNSTIWTRDFSEKYFETLLFSEKKGAISMRNYFIEQSSGRYAVNGDVSPWVQVPNNAASYGANYCDDIVCADTWRFVNDSVDAFAKNFPTTAALEAYLAQFDVWDRYDFNGNGNFDEPDGYIDHFQSVHAGEGEETGGGAQGTDAIWSHRWYAYFGGNGPDGAGPTGAAQGGVQIGDSKYWIGDYTVEPENGGVGVFAHEFGHDLGLPDLYDTSGNTGGAENSTGFWTLYSSGSYGNSGRPKDGIGSKPIPLGNWERFQLGWLNYKVVNAGTKASLKLGPSWFNSKAYQGVFIVLPDRVVPLNLGAPCPECGSKYFYSGSGDSLMNTMTKAVPGGGALTAKVRYDIEFDWDYAFLQSSIDNGATWQSVLTNKSQTDSDGQNSFNVSRTGITGDTAGAWVDLTATLPAGTNMVRFLYHTDEAFALSGFQVDNIAIGGTSIGTAEADEGWVLAGFRTTTGSETQSFFNAYVLENRQYLGYDQGLKTGPYNFGWGTTKPNLVEHFPYQDGLLISYWNSQYTDNNVGDHPGEGLVLPIDAHPQFTHWRDGTLMRPRILSFDSTFGLQRTPRLRLHLNGVTSTIPARSAVSTFYDNRSYWKNCDSHACTGSHAGRYQPGWYGVDNPHTGTKVRVRSVDRYGFMRIDINK
ncbi:MAG: immune inhibitor A domain-containing protein [Candidatus Limnocylindrales bacterium]